MFSPIFLAVIFFALLAVALGGVLLWTRPSHDDEVLHARLDELHGTRPEVLDGSTALRVTQHTVEASSTWQGLLQHRAFDGVRTLLAQSKSSLTPGELLFRSFACGAALGVAATLGIPLLAPRIAAFAAGAALPTLWLRQRMKRRLAKFQEALPEAADLMSRALRAGHSVQQALELVATESTGPLAEEFRQLHQEQKFGVPLKEALRALAARVPSADLQFLVTAIIVQKETGGDLIEILERTTHVIRDRLRVEREVKTYTAQGRLTGWILSALPVVLLALIALVSPTYSTVLFHDPMGQTMLTGAGCLIVIGSFVIRRVVKVEV